MSSTAEIVAATVSRTKRLGLQRMSLLAAAVATAYGVLLIVPASSRADDSVLTAGSVTSCPDVQVVFARGTGEAPGAGRVGEAFADSVRSLVNGKSVAVYGVEYPASYDFLRAIDGVNDASTFIENAAQACPRTKMVLGGYPREPRSSTCSPQPVAPSSDSPVPCRTRSQTTSPQWSFSVTRRTTSANH